MDNAAVARQLVGAELWMAEPATGPDGARTALVAGWEDGAPFCAAVCSTDVGLAFCRRCPEQVVARVAASGRAASGRCGAGVRLLAFPAPRGDRGSVAVLRPEAPDPRRAARIADTVKVASTTLRRAAREAQSADGRAALAAARVLRDGARLHDWAVGQRNRGADRRRTATAALAQMIATSEEFHELFRSSQRQRSALERNQRRLDRLARETLRAKDEERALIAHEIHDTAAQSLVSAFRFLEAARATAETLPGPTADHLAAAGERLQAAIREIRQVLNRLLPPGLEELGLAHAIGARLNDLTTGTDAVAHLTGDLPRLAPLVEQTLFGMAAEAIANAIHHGHAQSIDVELRQERGRAVVVVRDDGVGFDPAAVGRRTDGGGLGLLGLTRQASWLGGRATIASRPGHGTTIRLAIPTAWPADADDARVSHHHVRRTARTGAEPAPVGTREGS
jgi:signal transduction histidine kinase